MTFVNFSIDFPDCFQRRGVGKVQRVAARRDRDKFAGHQENRRLGARLREAAVVRPRLHAVLELQPAGNRRENLRPHFELPPAGSGRQNPQKHEGEGKRRNGETFVL